MWQAWVNQLLGIWLAVAPLIPLNTTWMELGNLYVGTLAAFLSASFPVKKVWLSWLGLAAGAWTAISSRIYSFQTGEGYLWNNVICGALIFLSAVLAVASVSAEKEAQDPALRP